MSTREHSVGAGAASVTRHAARRRPPIRTLRVLRTAELSPCMRRVTLGGPELRGFTDEHVGPNIKVFIPRRDQQCPVLPDLDHETGRYRWPEPERRPTMRTYTVRRYDAERGELDVDFVLHGHGVAAGWAASAAPGDLVGVTGPGGRTPRAADWYLLAGDQSALPAIASILESLPITARGHAFIEVPDATEEQPLHAPPQVEVTWLYRNGLGAGRSRLLSDAVEKTALPSGAERVSAWVAGESSTVRDLRRHLRNERGLDPRQVLAIGYWKLGLVETDYHDKYNHDRE